MRRAGGDYSSTSAIFYEHYSKICSRNDSMWLPAGIDGRLGRLNELLLCYRPTISNSLLGRAACNVCYCVDEAGSSAYVPDDEICDAAVTFAQTSRPPASDMTRRRLVGSAVFYVSKQLIHVYAGRNAHPIVYSGADPNRQE